MDLCRTPIYKTWADMKYRCRTRTSPFYYSYGGRGITYINRWENFTNFLLDMGNKPVGYSLERKNVNGKYSKRNCIWIPKCEQMRNRRTSRLTWEKVRAIRKAIGSNIIIAKRYKVDPSTISRILSNTRWKEL